MKHLKLILAAILLITASNRLSAEVKSFEGDADNSWTATASDACDNGSTISFDGMMMTIGAANDGVNWTWHAGNGGLLPSQMPSTGGNAGTLITSFSETAPFGPLPTHGAFLKIEPSSVGKVTIRGLASRNTAQPLIFVTTHRSDPSTILAVKITAWDANVSQWEYDVDNLHTYYFFQLSYPGQLSSYRFTLKGASYEKTGEGINNTPDKHKVGYLYNGNLNTDRGYQFLVSQNLNDVTPVEANKEFTTEDFSAFETIVISSTVTNSDAIASLGEVRPFVPMLNLNPDIYEKWGYGKMVNSGINFATVLNPAHALFKELNLVEDPNSDEKSYVLPLCSYLSFKGLQLSGIFADDPVLAVAYQNKEIVAVHTHNLTHNGYIYLPYTQDLLADAVTPGIINNAISILCSSKSLPEPAPTPEFLLEYAYKSTIVTITDAAQGVDIFYTLDGSEPTESSTRYTGPFAVSENVTVKAVACGEGFVMSNTGVKDVDIRQVCHLPVFNTEHENGRSIVTISTEIPGARIYYNYKGDSVVSLSSLYTGPIVCTSNRTIYAFQTCDGYITSKLASENVSVDNPHIRIDILSQMDANKNEYFECTNADDFDAKNGWSVHSCGQSITWLDANPTLKYGDASNFNPETVEDENIYLPATNGLLDLGKRNISASANAKIQSTTAFAGPFDVVMYIANNNGNELFSEVVRSEWTATSTDGCNMGTLLPIEGAKVTLGSSEDNTCNWTWHAGNAGLLPSQMPSVDGTAGTLITSFSEEAPYGNLPSHGAFLKIEPAKAGSVTISGKASASADQPLIFVTCEKNAPDIIVSAKITAWNADESSWTYNVDEDHVYYFFQQAYPEKLTAYRFTLRGVLFESVSDDDTSSTDGDAIVPQVAVEVAASSAADAEWTQLGDVIELPKTGGLYRMSVRSYEGTEPVFVRTRIVNDALHAGFLNIYVTYEGEESRRILGQDPVGIDNVELKICRSAGIYSVNGVRLSKLQRGLNIVVSSEGKVKVVRFQEYLSPPKCV